MDAGPSLVVGTAGHIDHGKSRLVEMLTGTNPDRLPEEQARGMTIDLGFAHAALEGASISFVDVPGHERFIRNMLAGAGGIDVALLVVAADDSVMPQTREHAEVLALLGIPRVVIVLTKLDLVDDAWADQVEEEARELLEKLRLHVAGVVRTSAVTGRGLDELRRVLVAEARAAAPASLPYAWFRMPVDRAFVAAGRGAVVTGTVAHGGVARGDELELWPAGTRVRVRDLQSHHVAREAAAGHTRLAINLAGVEHHDLRRGDTLATPGFLQTARFLDVWLAWLRMPGKTRRQMLHVRLHLATGETLAELRLADGAEAEGGGQYGQLRTAEGVAAVWGQRFILRDEAGTRTLGGGVVLRPAARGWTARRPAHLAGLEALRTGGASERLAEAIRAAEWQGLDARRLATIAGLADEGEAGRRCAELTKAGTVVAFEASAARLLVHRSHLEALGADLKRRLTQHLAENPRVLGVPRAQWPSWMPGACAPKFRAAVGEWFVGQGKVAEVAGHMAPAEGQPALSAADQALLAALLAEFEEGAFAPPALETLRCRTAKNEKRLRELAVLAEKRGQLVRVAEGMWLHGRRWEELTARVAAGIRERGGLTVADIRSLLNSSRKYVVPIVEKLDQMGITRRQGDLRVLGEGVKGLRG